MKNSRLITQSHTKRATAAAIANAKARNRWSNSDAADALGTCEGTIRNRLDADCPKHQMTVHELLRSIQSDPRIADDILSVVGHKAEPLERVEDRTSDRAKESSVLAAALALSVALNDDQITDEEIVANRQTLENAAKAIAALLDRAGPRRRA